MSAADGAIGRKTDVAKEKEGAGKVQSEAAARFGKCAACGAGHRPDTWPQLLPCLHSLCKVCLQQSAQEDVKVCPVCNSIYTVTEVKNDPFFREHTYNSEDQMQSKCGGCEDSAVSGWCVECGEVLCAACVLAHRRVRVTRDHKILPQQLSKGHAPTAFCLTHKEEPMKLFCLSCDELTCRDCQLTYHRHHRFQFVSEVMPYLKQNVRELMEKVQRQKGHVKQSLLDLDGRLSDLTVLQVKVKTELRNTILSIRDVLVARAIQLVREMQGYCGREIDSISKRQEVLVKLTEHQEHVLAFAERALSIDDHLTLLTCKKEIQQQLQNLLSRSTQPTASMIEVKLQYDQDLHRIITNYGQILVKEVPFKSSVRSFPSKHLVPAPEPTPPRQSSDTHKSCSAQPVLPSPLAHQSTERSHVCVVPTSHQTIPVSLPHLTPGWKPLPIVGSHSLPSPVSPFPLGSCPPPILKHHFRTKSPTVSLHSVQSNRPQATGKRASPCVAPPASTLVATSGALPLSVFLSPVVIVPLVSPTVGLPQNVKSNLKKIKHSHAAATRPKDQAVPASSQITTLLSLGSVTTPAVCVGSAQPIIGLPPDSSCSVLPVKALADSPCERLPPTESTQKAKQVLMASENEPTSTVMETDTPFSTEDSVIEDLVSSQPGSTDERLAAQITAPMSTDSATITLVTADDNVGIGNAVTAVTVTGVTEHPTTMTAASRNKAVVSKEVTIDSGNTATDTHMVMPVANTTAGGSATELATDISTADVNVYVDKQTTLARSNNTAIISEPNITTGQHVFQPTEQIHIEASACGQISSPTLSGKCKPSQSFTISSNPSMWPSSLREILEKCTMTAPQADSLSPELDQQKMSEGFTSLKNAKVGSPLSSTQVKLEDASFGCLLEENDDCGETNLDSERTHAYNNLMNRCRLPCVSLFRIPIPMTPPGHPLPCFRLVPGTTKNEILLQIIEEKGQFSVSLDSATVSTCLRVPPAPPENDRKAYCAVCRVPGAAIVCSVCGCSFHRKCHIPAVNSETSSGHWQCMLCRDFSDVGDQYCSSVDGCPSLSLLEQRKCEHVLLVLLCATNSSALYQQVESSSHSSRSVSIMHVQGRLLRDLKPPYCTPSEFVSDVRLLLDILKSSKESSKIAKLQSCFEKTLLKVFGRSINNFPKYAFNMEQEARKRVEMASSRQSETLKRMREFLRKNVSEPPVKRNKEC